MTENTDRYLLSAKEASRWLGIPVTTLYGWAHSGKMPHYKVHKRVLFRKADMIQWLEEHHRSRDRGLGFLGEEVPAAPEGSSGGKRTSETKAPGVVRGDPSSFFGRC